MALMLCVPLHQLQKMQQKCRCLHAHPDHIGLFAEKTLQCPQTPSETYSYGINTLPFTHSHSRDKVIGVPNCTSGGPCSRYSTFI